MLLAALLLMAAALASWTTPSDAGDSDHELARQALQQGRVLPLRTVLDQVERDYQGQVIKVEFEHDDGRFICTASLNGTPRKERGWAMNASGENWRY